LREKAIARLVCDKAGITSDKLGDIALKREFSFFDVERSVAQKVLKSLKGISLGGRRIHARFADPAKPGRGARPEWDHPVGGRLRHEA